jgi:DNA-binding CsgD family transcriptional regulator/N-acetylneuraminic acid mutarotase
MAEQDDPLSSREIDVLEYLVQGASNKEIAAALFISENTVKVHLRRVFRKLDVSSRTEATTVALQQGLVSIPGLEVETEATEASEPEPEPEIVEMPVEMSAAFEPKVERDTAAAPPPIPRATLFNWRIVSAILGILVIVLAVAFITSRLSSGNNVTSTPEPFTETDLGDRWVLTNRPLLKGRANMAVVSDGVNVYEIGGDTADSVSSAINVYNVTEHAWRELTIKPTAVAATTAAVLFGEIYVPGGRLADGQPTDVVEVYSPAQDAWRSVASLPQPVAGGLALSDGSFLYLFGGWNGNAYLDTTYQYDPGANSWRPLESMARPRAFATGKPLTGQLYVVGGFDGTDEFAECQYLDLNNLEWFDCPDMLLPRSGAGAAVVLNKLYVIGGGMNGRTPISFSEVYVPTSATWQVVNTPMLDENTAWHGLGVANVETRIFIFGGQQGDTFVTNNYILTPVFQVFIPRIEINRNQ